MDDALTELAGLAYFMLPAWLANMAPPFTRFWPCWNRPIHRELLGDHKTVIGFAFALVVGFLAVAAQAITVPPASRRLTPVLVTRNGGL